MRNVALLLSFGLVIAACGDAQHPSAPLSRRAGGVASPDVAPSDGAAKHPDAKPADQVGFTKIQAYYGTPITLYPGQDGTATMSCPAGSVVTGGGFEMYINSLGPEPAMWRSRATGPVESATGWIVSASNRAIGAVEGNLQAWVSCAS